MEEPLLGRSSSATQHPDLGFDYCALVNIKEFIKIFSRLPKALNSTDSKLRFKSTSALGENYLQSYTEYFLQTGLASRRWLRQVDPLLLLLVLLQLLLMKILYLHKEGFYLRHSKVFLFFSETVALLSTFRVTFG